MLMIETMPVGPLGTNCYIVYQDNVRQALIIDPGFEADRITNFLDSNNLQPDLILATHGHFDHLAVAQLLCDQYQLDMYLHQADWQLAASLPAWASGMLPADYRPITSLQDLPASGQLDFLGETIQIVHTPGHTPGSVIYVIGSFIFAGDLLFYGSIGRTDLPGGDWEQMQNSLEIIASYPDAYQVFPGHGESTTIGMEKAENPFLLAGK